MKSIRNVPNFIYGKQLLIELYETEYGIRNHLHSTSPLGSIAFNKAETYLKDYMYDSYLSLFIYKDIGKKLNISFDDFIKRPRFEIDAILRIIDEIDKLREKVTKDHLNELEGSNSDLDLEI